jgi:hypothetical protein
MDRIFQAGGLCVRSSYDLGSEVARRVRGLSPFLASYRPEMFFLCGVLPLEVLMVTRDSLANDFHRMANYTECQLSYFLCELLSEGRLDAVHELAWVSTRFISVLRQIRDNKEGGCDE